VSQCQNSLATISISDCLRADGGPAAAVSVAVAV